MVHKFPLRWLQIVFGMPSLGIATKQDAPIDYFKYDLLKHCPTSIQISSITRYLEPMYFAQCCRNCYAATLTRLEALTEAATSIHIDY